MAGLLVIAASSGLAEDGIYMFSAADVGKRAQAPAGVCAFHPVNKGLGLHAEAMPMNYQQYMLGFLPKDFVRRLGKFTSEADLKRWEEWDASLKIDVVRSPTHGEMILDPAISEHPAYRPTKYFEGRDRVEVLVSGRDFNGRHMSRKVVFFINVVAERDMAAVLANYAGALKKYCGRGSSTWRPPTAVLRERLVWTG